MTSLKPLVTLTLLLAISTQHTAVAHASGNEITHEIAQGIVHLSNESVASLKQVAAFIEAKKLDAPPALRNVFAHLLRTHNTIAFKDLKAGADAAAAILKKHAARSREKDALLKSLDDLCSLTYTIANNVAVTGIFSASTTANIGTGLTVTSGGATVSAGGLTISADGANITGTTVITGNEAVSGTLDVTGVTTMTTTAHAGYLHAAGPLEVSGATTLGGAVTLNNNMACTGSARFTGSGTGITVTNDATIGGSLEVSLSGNFGTGLNVAQGPVVFSQVGGRMVPGGVAVLIGTNGELGTISSSHRYKDDIQDMNDQSAALMQLRPVSFTYKADEAKSTQFGLIAEEVEQVMPELVIHKDGQPETVAYHVLPSLLLNEAIRQNKHINAQDNNNEIRFGTLEQEIAELRTLNTHISAQDNSNEMRFSSLEQELAELRTTHNNLISAQDNNNGMRFSALEQELAELRTHSGNVNTQDNNNEMRLNTLEQELAKLHTHSSNFNARNNRNEIRVGMLEQELAELRAQLVILRG